MTEKLKPCPFCGSGAQIVLNVGEPKRRGLRHPSCTNYDCPGFVAEQDEQGGTNCDAQTDAEAAALWNTRPAPAAPTREEVIDLIGSACDGYSARGRHGEKQAVVERYADAILALFSRPAIHASDCATHNEPAFPNGPCDCGASFPRPAIDPEVVERVRKNAEMPLGGGQWSTREWCAVHVSDLRALLKAVEG